MFAVIFAASRRNGMLGACFQRVYFLHAVQVSESPGLKIYRIAAEFLMARMSGVWHEFPSCQNVPF